MENGSGVSTLESIGVYAVSGRVQQWYHTPNELNPEGPPIHYQWVEFSADSQRLIARRYRRRQHRSEFVAFDVDTGEVKRERQLTAVSGPP